MIVRMWEARVEPGCLDAVTAWLRDQVLPAALAAEGCVGAEAFVASGDADRVVVISRWVEHRDWSEGEPDGPLLARAHAWEFEPLPIAAD